MQRQDPFIMIPFDTQDKFAPIISIPPFIINKIPLPYRFPFLSSQINKQPPDERKFTFVSSLKDIFAVGPLEQHLLFSSYASAANIIKKAK